jgi:hypothetical protein
MGVDENRVLDVGERHRLIASGNINFPKTARMASPELLKWLDPIMLDFLVRFEEYLGLGQIATFCADMGILAGNKPVLYEWQGDFTSPLEYYLGIPGQRRVRPTQPHN